MRPRPRRSSLRRVLGLVLGGLVGLPPTALRAEATPPPVPWENGERLVFTLEESGQRAPVGFAVSSIEETGEAPAKRWRIRFRVWLGRSALSLVEVDQESFLPIYSFYRSQTLGEVEAHYGNGGVSIEHHLEREQGQLRRWDRTHTIYQSFYLMRQFPLREGYQKEIYVVNSRKPLDQEPTVMRLTDFDRLNTPLGRVDCYQVDAIMDGARRSFWLGTDERRLLYRVEEETGLAMELLRVESPDPDGWKTVRGDVAPYTLEVPDDWCAFPHPGKKPLPDQDRLVFLLPEAEGEFSMTRHPRFGDLDAVVEGSIRWLEGNKHRFALEADSLQAISGPGWSGEAFRGAYDEAGERHGLYHAILQSDEGLYLFTGSGPVEGFSTLVDSFRRIVDSMRVSAPAGE